MMKLQISSFDEYKAVYQRSVEDPEGFWAEVAETFHWDKKWDKVLEWEFKTPSVKWFQGGKTNITYNALDRHLPERANQTALIWEPNEPGDPVKKYTYCELYEEVNKVANALKKLGIKKGDRICFYLPMVPELAIGVLASARIGAVHSVVFAG
ncbi:MAG: acetyl-coenzyme A synthetase, partial [Bacteroidetes bacterium]